MPATTTPGDTLRWLLALYRAAQEMPPETFKDDVFHRLGQLIPVSSGIWATTARAPEGGLTYLGMHLYEEPPTLADELPGANNRYPQSIAAALAHPGQSQINYSYRMHSPEWRDYIVRYGHANNLLIVDRAQRHERREWISLYRSRRDHHFTPSDQHLLDLVLPHISEALALNRQAGGWPAGAGSSIAGTRALVQQNGVLVTCGEPFRALLRRRWADWCSARLPVGLLGSLRPGLQHLRARDGVIVLRTERLGPYLFLQAGEPCCTRPLSPRQAQVAELYAAGRTHRQIASALKLQPTTVRNVVQRIYAKLDVGDKAGLVQALEAMPWEGRSAPGVPVLAPRPAETSRAQKLRT